jgi:transposase
MKVKILGIDLAKNVFSVHGVDGRGKTVLQHRELRRRQLLPFMRQLQPCAWWEWRRAAVVITGRVRWPHLGTKCG